MARILILTGGTLGDVLPMVYVAGTLQSRGHEVRVVAHDSMRTYVEERRLVFVSAGGNNPEVVQQDYARSAPGASPWRVVRHLSRLFRSPAVPQWEEVTRFGNDMEWCDLVVGSHMCVPAVHLAEKLHRRWVTLHPTPTLPSGSYAHPVGPLWWHLLLKPRFINRATHAAWARLVTNATKEWTNDFRTRGLGLGPLTRSALAGLVDGLPKVVPASPTLFPIWSDWPADWHLTGYPREDGDPAGGLSPEVESFLKAGDPPVFIGFSSSPISNPSFWTDVVAGALDRLGRRAIIGAGWSNVPEGLASSARLVVKHVSYRGLFPRVACVVHACGIGTFSEAAWSGVSSVGVPVFGEQKFIAVRAYKAGLIPRPVMAKKLTARKLYDLLRSATGDTKRLSSVSRVARQMRTEDGLVRASEAIEQYLPK